MIISMIRAHPKEERESSLATKLRAIMLGLAMMFAMTIAPAQAASLTDNLAGRPISGNASTWCQGTGYGRVDGQMVLFTAAHCINGTGQNCNATTAPCWNGVVNGDNGSRLGIVGPNPVTLGVNAHDLAYIKLDAGHWPTTRNQVYGGTSGYWTITTGPDFTLDCTHVQSYIGTQGYQFFQPSSSSTNSYRQGTFQAVAGGANCVLDTNIPVQPSYKDSGSPFILSGRSNTITGIGSSTGPNGIAFSPLIEGIAGWNVYWFNHGTKVGVRLCTAAAC